MGRSGKVTAVVKVGSHLFSIREEGVRAATFEVAPDLFDRVEFRSVAWEVLKV